MAPAQDSPSKKRTSWTPELNQQLFMALLKTLDPSAINYGKIAEELGGGFSNQAIYKRIYDIKNRGVSFEISAAAPKKPNSTTTSPKKRKVAADAEEDL
ncbi:uncharacterized protein BHQ10_010013 [Talaromyces amestolkiae]|uniref:Myb/SANT-like domain-containing protein n=1 Tax=Talaromyces amestolkiae TaxID=1196081 RepID=A0A364LE62_TALAM|nr:uncharacterized protein BHQ10_010013 [Talaromyces amestolkiae]RAO74001.1 hypothetical protein BHQ10_010013 [Talaromyces amestolkiae]